MLLRLQGGLGNQLFQLIALRYLSRQHHTEQKNIYPAHLGLFKTKRELAITPFFADENIITEMNKVDELLFRTKASKLFSRFSIHSISSVRQLDTWKGQFLNGYFQDVYNYKNIEILKEEIRQLDIIINSKAREQALPVEETDCAIHLRLSDFVETQRQQDYLSSYRLPYIKKGIDIFRNRHGVKRFVLFTDTPAEARQLIPDQDVLFYNDIAPENAGLFREFCTMCSFGNFIGSNSTFSFWGSLLGRKKQIIFPGTWDKLKRADNRIFKENFKVYHKYSIHNSSVEWIQ